MKTTVDIPDQLLADAKRFTKSTTKRDAIIGGLQEFVRRMRVEEFLKQHESSDTFMTNEELMQMRQEQAKYAPANPD